MELITKFILAVSIFVSAPFGVAEAPATPVVETPSVVTIQDDEQPPAALELDAWQTYDDLLPNSPKTTATTSTIWMGSVTTPPTDLRSNQFTLYSTDLGVYHMYEVDWTTNA